MNKRELEPLILDGISQILAQRNRYYYQRNLDEWPLEHDEIEYLLENLQRELQDPTLHSGLIYLYGHIVEYIKDKIVYN